MNWWVAYVRQRCSELHRFVFDPRYCERFDRRMVLDNRLAYRAWHAELNRLGFGRDESGLPQLQLPLSIASEAAKRIVKNLS